MSDKDDYVKNYSVSDILLVQYLLDYFGSNTIEKL